MDDGLPPELAGLPGPGDEPTSPRRRRMAAVIAALTVVAVVLLTTGFGWLLAR